jgi:glycosyltransferase involved in cell wall biosynthesis
MPFGRGGVFAVGHYLPKALANQIDVIYYPSYFPRSYAINLLKVYSGFVRRDFNVVHFNYPPIWMNGGYGLFALAKRTGAATLLNIHGILQVEYILDSPHTKKFRSSMYKNVTSTLRSCKQVDKLVTYSEFMRSQIVAWYGIKRDKIAVIPNGVDLRRFSKNIFKQKLDGDPAILYFGYLSNFKGIDLLIHAISKLQIELPNLKLHLVGHGDKSSFELLAKEKHVEKAVVFHGYADPKAAPQYFQAADFCIFPSRRDSFGITLLEAMASGTSVIASNRGGTPEIISNGRNGILFEPENADALPKAILALSQDSELRKRISSNALKTVSNYSWENIANKYIALYKCLAE